MPPNSAPAAINPGGDPCHRAQRVEEGIEPRVVIALTQRAEFQIEPLLGEEFGLGEVVRVVEPQDDAGDGITLGEHAQVAEVSPRLRFQHRAWAAKIRRSQLLTIEEDRAAGLEIAFRRSQVCARPAADHDFARVGEVPSSKAHFGMHPECLRSYSAESAWLRRPSARST